MTNNEHGLKVVDQNNKVAALSVNNTPLILKLVQPAASSHFHLLLHDKLKSGPASITSSYGSGAAA